MFGFLTMQPADASFTFNDADTDYPETWIDHDAAGNPRTKSTYRKARAQSVLVAWSEGQAERFVGRPCSGRRAACGLRYPVSVARCAN